MESVLFTASERPNQYGAMMAHSTARMINAQRNGWERRRSISAKDKSVSGMEASGCLETSTVSTLPPTISVASLGSCSLDSCSMHRLADYLLIAMYCHADYCDAYLSVRVGQVPDVPCGFAH